MGMGMDKDKEKEQQPPKGRRSVAWVCCCQTQFATSTKRGPMNVCLGYRLQLRGEVGKPNLDNLSKRTRRPAEFYERQDRTDRRRETARHTCAARPYSTRSWSICAAIRPTRPASESSSPPPAPHMGWSCEMHLLRRRKGVHGAGKVYTAVCRPMRCGRIGEGEDRRANFSLLKIHLIALLSAKQWVYMYTHWGAVNCGEVARHPASTGIRQSRYGTRVNRGRSRPPVEYSTIFSRRAALHLSRASP